MILLSPDPLDPPAVCRAVEHPGHGGLAMFVGLTRDERPGRAVVALEYDGHEPLAVAEMTRIAHEAAQRHGARVAIAHRLGRVAVGEPSVVIAASAPHRAEAFAACREGIDELKRRVPIWKCSHFADGGREWDAGLPWDPSAGSVPPVG